MNVTWKVESWAPPHAPQFCVCLNKDGKSSVIYRNNYRSCLEMATSTAKDLGVDLIFEEPKTEELKERVKRLREFDSNYEKLHDSNIL